MNKEKILIDTDMGNDDIMAISMILRSARFQIAGYTLMDGVARTPAGSKNLSALLDYFDKPSPIAIGPTRTFQGSVDFPPIDIKRAEELTLLEGLNIQPKDSVSNIQTFDSLVKESLSEPLTIFALGPMTNIAAMIENYPQFIDRVNRIVIMGGGIQSGNVSPYNLAEYNIALDPPSAAIVFKSKTPLVMIGIDATKSVPATPEFAREVTLLAPGTNEGAVIRKIIINNNGDVNQFYDPLAAAILIDSNLITESRKGEVRVIQRGEAIGRTVFRENPEGSTTVAFSANAYKFYQQTKELITQEEGY